MPEFDYSKRPGKRRTRFYSPDINEALVTIVTPYYNAGEYFEETFNSVMNQTFPWFEWIIVNDGSTNQTDIDILRKYAKEDGRIKVVDQVNGGSSCARNTGFSCANTGLVVPLDADDLIAPQYLEYLYWALYYNEAADWAYTDSVGFQDQEYVWKKKFSAKRMKRENILVPTAMIRKQAYEEIGGYKVEKQHYNEDWRFWLEMLGRHKKPIRVPLELSWYRRSAQGMLSTIRKNPEQQKFSDRIIRKTAKSVDTKVKEIKVIDNYQDYPFYRAKYSEYNRFNDQKNENKRVLWLIPQMVMGGADKFNLDAVAGLRNLNYKNYILTTIHANHAWRQRFEDFTDEVYCMAEFLSPVHFCEYASYIIQSRQIDIMIVSNSYAGYYMLPWIREHFPKLVIVDYLHLEEWYWRAGGYARTAAALNGITEKTYVCNSSTRRVLIDEFGCNPETVECMYIGVDHIYFDKTKENAGYLHKRLGISDERPIVLFPCRISEQKRPFMIINIAQGLIKAIPDVAFAVVGDGPQLAELQRAIRSKGLQKHIYCNGASDNMRACYRDADVVLICSINEGLALTAYEACAMGVPVVSSDVGGQKDLIGDDVGALIPMRQMATDIDNRKFSQTEIDMYVDKLAQILGDADYASQLGNAARNKIETGFSIELMVKQLDRELQTLYNDSERSEKRRRLSEGLRLVPHFSTDYYTIYLEWEGIFKRNRILSMLYSVCASMIKIPMIRKLVVAASKII